MPESSTINEAEVLKVLMQEYLSARKEILLHLQLYKTVPVRNAAILIAVVGLLIPALSGQKISLPGTGVVVQLTPWLELLLLFTISTIAFLLIFSVLALLFALQVLAERCVWLEREINKLLRGPYLLWEHFAHQIWSKDSALVYKMPDAAATVFFYLLVLIFSVGLPVLLLMKIHCGAPGPQLAMTMYVYTVYLFAVPAISFYVNAYTMGSLRRHVRELFEATRAGKVLPHTPSGLLSIILIVMAAAIAAGIFTAVIPRPTSAFCTDIGIKVSVIDAD